MDPRVVDDETTKAQVHARIAPCPTYEQQSLSEMDRSRPRDEKTIYYLAYGSNLAAETFRGRRNIHPLSATNVVVPQLRLSFDLPGIAYAEPCFANSATREGWDDPTSQKVWRAPTLSSSYPPYHKDRWRKGLVGVAYELTPTDYAHVLATEGGGAAYQDVVVDCFVLSKGCDVVPDVPNTTPLRAHTLFAPAKTSPGDHGRLARPNSSYAQPSARYLKLITDGAIENDLPREYRDYLGQIRPYRITSQRQRLGQYIFLAIWRPIISLVIQLVTVFSNRHGRAPSWVLSLAAATFAATWSSYDSFFVHIFGDGERTEGEGPELASNNDNGLTYHSSRHGSLEKGDVFLGQE